MRSVSLADATPSVWPTVALWNLITDSDRLNVTFSSISAIPGPLPLKSTSESWWNTSRLPTARIQQHVDELLARKEITYDLLWALFRPNTEVYATCRGTGAPRCVVYNHCEEMKRRDGARYLHVSTRCLNSDGKVLGETTVGIEIDIFRGVKRIELLSAYPLQYHPEPDTIRKQLIECGHEYVSLMGIHHRSIPGAALPRPRYLRCVAACRILGL
ncbi:hypothetical protein QBC46DRAFT_362098 [Diplogelasinospora grovesii]|uniref:DUF7025 domain-containing protein n=1 Tax=Diplogelasinospora grovesii TaxID=303347 RepID=A0AAN6S7D6_9PEZI|nr:hypothetical protein QBC46DRAFT_362098 [Diplogelasinospora grovesii]